MFKNLHFLTMGFMSALRLAISSDSCCPWAVAGGVRTDLSSNLSPPWSRLIISCFLAKANCCCFRSSLKPPPPPPLLPPLTAEEKSSSSRPPPLTASPKWGSKSRGERPPDSSRNRRWKRKMHGQTLFELSVTSPIQKVNWNLKSFFFFLKKN